MIRRTAFACAVVLLCSLTASAAPETAKQPPVVGTWQGSLPNGMGAQIRVVLHVERTPQGALSATMDSPDQNATGIPVAKVTLEDKKLTLEVTAVGGGYEGTIDEEKNEISGTWKQNGQQIPLVLKKDVAKK